MIDAIAALWSSDKSMSEIGDALGGVSRGQVAGAIHRAREAGDARFGPRPVAPKAPIVAPSVVIVAPPQPARHAPRLLVDLDWNGCRWAMNSAAKGEPHLFCGAPQAPGRPYCAEHCGAVTSPASPSAVSRRAPSRLRGSV